MTEFKEFPKIARLNREMVVTEKIDGTNAQILIADDGQVLAGSRNRFVTPEQDNYGFAKWVKAHEDELRGLGPGTHYGEWWGSGIQRGYGLLNGEKRFSLFNVGRWHDAHGTNSLDKNGTIEGTTEAPACCYVVPILWRSNFNTLDIAERIDMLRQNGSSAAPGFMCPEGVVIFHVASGQLFKVTLDKDEQPKGVR